MVSNRKWKIALWGMVLGTVIAMTAIVSWVLHLADGSAGFLSQGIGLIAVVIGMYSTANVVQKRGGKNE